ncbi:gamma-glutamyltransferase [Azospirillum halopraeferens]|uniref:gamma-glutamyltransferase n=1 Tax=Azospirillum halopraeferens TaxID=34010 RepID=UPI000418989C|nr:gamma-glutamyltransferase [Azospirillum halopraeferens]
MTIAAPPDRRRTGWLYALALAVLLAPAAPLPAGAAGDVAPEGATGRTQRAPDRATRHMAAAANPLAASAGREILRAGGSAVDAAIAMQMVLGLVEPQSSGIAGGAFLLHWDAAARTLTTLDGRETAPMAATPERFLKPDGTPMAFFDAVVGGRSVGVPGVPRLLELAHRRHGRLPWRDLFAPAIRLAEAGFAVSPRLHGLLAQDKHLRDDPAARALYYGPDGAALPIGATLRNPEYAAVLRAVAEGGADAFHTGPIAAAIAAAVAGHPANPGDLTPADLAAYRARERPPVCGPYRGYTVCGMGPPSSGGIAVLQILGVLEAQDAAASDPIDAAHRFAEAGRLAFADRARYLADPDYVPVPVRGLIDPGYIAGRAALVDPQRSMGRAEAGTPPWRQGALYGASEGVEHGTSHIAVVDGQGNAVSMTTSIESAFGARLMVRGMLLNNQLTDFAFEPVADGLPVANRVEPGKRPRSSMAPTIVFDGDGNLRAVVGSPGGSQIIGYVAKTLVGLLERGLDPQVAVDLPNFGSRNGPTELEKGTEAETWKAALEARGHTVSVIEMTSGTQAIVVTPDGLVGGADTRREGAAAGD